MTATEELRRMLDERGVEWMDDSDGQLWRTVWHGSDGKQWRMNEKWHMSENRSGMLTELRAWQPTPEQAIEATLGRGTCHIVKTWSDSDFVDGWRYSCSVCECFIPVDERDPETGDVISAANYCPNCGRKVVDE